VDQCTSCDLNSRLPYLYGYRCLESCPRGFYPSFLDGSTCNLISEDVVPFVFLSITLLVIFLITCSKLCNFGIHAKNTQIALITIICKANWFFLLYLTWKDEMWQSAVVLLYGLTSSYILNLLFFCLYWKVMRKDSYYGKWRESAPWEPILVFFAILTSFQLYRIIFSRLAKTIKLEKENPSNVDKKYKFTDENTVKSIFNKLTVIMISCVLAPIII
jgi:hypothetical protein